MAGWMSTSGTAEDGLVLTGIAGALVRDLPDIDRVRQQRIEGTARERLPADTGPVPIHALFRSCPLSIEVFLEQPHRAEFAVAGEDQPHRLGFFVQDD